MSIYQRINGDAWRNVWVVGDLHGCYTNLINQLENIGFEADKDLLISVGDLIDRGAENVECLDLINQPWFRAVRGNHEQMMLDAMLNGGSFGHWMINGGGWLHQLDYEQELRLKTLLPKVGELPLIIELVTRDRKVVICHADYPHNEYAFGKPVTEEMVIWNRERVSDAMDGRVSEITGADLFIFGHTPAIRTMRFSNQLYIDTGAVFTAHLTLVNIGEAL
ncbi:metallophosphoesterase [Pseudescherichia sp.]|uniref:metallophosphoesterase n=1 Tax=Pseudescherichia sp. TaxID=2055881 RepID=UPI0028AEE6FB|nr:metallophosphoesterase [Pseudescherichia sp.]